MAEAIAAISVFCEEVGGTRHLIVEPRKVGCHLLPLDRPCGMRENERVAVARPHHVSLQHESPCRSNQSIGLVLCSLASVAVGVRVQYGCLKRIAVQLPDSVEQERESIQQIKSIPGRGQIKSSQS